jgi:hypothetical protein
MTASNTHGEAVHRSTNHFRDWLVRTGRAYSSAAREHFVRAHPALFGSAYRLTLRGYERWCARAGVSDTLGAFAEYIAPRHQRWS